MIFRNKIFLFALLTTLLGFAIIFRHLAISKLSPIIRVNDGIRPPPLAPNPHNDTVISGHTHYDHKDQKTEWTMEEWLEEAAHAHKIEEETMDWTPITEMCDKTLWRDDLIFECLDDPPNTRQTVLTCLRYAIDARAILYLPMFDDQAPAATDRQRVYTSLPLYIEQMAAICPGLEVYPRVGSSLESLGPSVRAPVLHPNDLPHWSLFGDQPVTSVKNYAHTLADSHKGIKTVIPFGPVSKYYPICADGALFADTFSQLYPWGSTLYRSADEIFWQLRANYSVSLTPGSGSSLPAIPTGGGQKSGFLAIRFETPANWIRAPDTRTLVEPTNIPSYEAQRVFFLNRMGSSKHGSHGLKIIYISAEEAIFKKFEKDLQAAFKEGMREGVKVVRVEDFGVEVEGMERGRRRESRESRAVLDYLVMLRATYFLGIAESETSWAVATRRRTKSKAGTCGYRKPWIPTVWGSAMWDEFSDLMGDRRYEEEWKIWP